MGARRWEQCRWEQGETKNYGTLRHRFQNAEEVILFVGEDAKKKVLAERAGFQFAAISASELVLKFGLEAAPVLIVVDSTGQLLYVGGYYDHPAAITPLDERIHAQLAKREGVEPLPVFGCAVSARLQKSLDPLGLANLRRWSER